MISVDAYIIPLEVTIKAIPDDGSGRRLVSVECSSEDVDDQGDVVLQKALMDSAGSFIKSGHLDLDHYSEIGHRLGLADPNSYIVGRPVEVNDLGNKRTGVVGEIMRSKDGTFDPSHNKYDGFWKTLQSSPPVHWSSSIYGYPSDIENCTEKACSSGATRYVVKAINWRSLAFTRKPVNTSLKGFAKIVTAKSFVDAVQKDMLSPFGLSDQRNMAPQLDVPVAASASVPEVAPPYQFPPNTLDTLWGSYCRHIQNGCPYCKDGNSVMAFKDHFIICCGTSSETADVLAHALMYLIIRDKKRRG
jgi:hypothetical protein